MGVGSRGGRWGTKEEQRSAGGRACPAFLRLCRVAFLAERFSDKTHDKTKSESALLSPSKAETLLLQARLGDLRADLVHHVFGLMLDAGLREKVLEASAAHLLRPDVCQNRDGEGRGAV